MKHVFKIALLFGPSMIIDRIGKERALPPKIPYGSMQLQAFQQPKLPKGHSAKKRTIFVETFSMTGSVFLRDSILGYEFVIPAPDSETRF
jgi:hypothetical protein